MCIRDRSKGPKRESRAVSVHGNDSGWVEHKELGVTYGFDCSKVMFSSGNGTEKKRMGFDVRARNEVIVDLYAGIGYYSLQLLKTETQRKYTRANGTQTRASICDGI